MRKGARLEATFERNRERKGKEVNKIEKGAVENMHGLNG